MLLIVVLSIYCLVMPKYGEVGKMGPAQMMTGSKLWHYFAIMNGIDQQYLSKSNSLKLSAKNILDGKKLYQQNCAVCHELTGKGDGEAGKNLSPALTNIVAFSKMPMASDNYLYWTIAEGGVPVESAMPPFKSSLKEEDIWKIITYLRVL
ncbi:MAG TPA: cytochrome c [Burkholderiaceae bacterium]